MKTERHLKRWPKILGLLGSTGLLLGLACAGSSKTSQPTAQSTLSVYAGYPGGHGYVDGPAAKARFSYAAGVAVDKDGNIYVADSRNSTIRKISPDGTVSTLAGSVGCPGSLDGAGAAAYFKSPDGLAVDAQGNVFVADAGNHLIRKITPAGVVSTVAGSAGQAGSDDGPGALARFNNPSGLALDGSGNLFVADNYNYTIRKITPEGMVSTFAGTAGAWDMVDGKGDQARFKNPSGMSLDGNGNLLVADTGASNIRKITPDGTVSTLAGGDWGSADGVGTQAQFGGVNDIAVDGSGNAYAADIYNHAIRKITPDGTVTTLAGEPGVMGTNDGTGSAAHFQSPCRVSVDKSGNVYVSDDRTTIRKITPSGVVTTIAGKPGQPGATNGEASKARFNWPDGMVVDRAGNLFVADQDNSLIRKITPQGVVSTFAGSTWGWADGKGAQAQFKGVGFLTIDATDTLYAADCSNNAIRKITPDGTVTTLAGNPNEWSGNADGTGADARFNGPNDVAVDKAGFVYVADYGNNTIRKVSPAGVVTTLAGQPGVAGGKDGQGSEATFNSPAGIAVDPSGHVYVSDYMGHTIRKITPSGLVSTLAGKADAFGAADGKGTAARFSCPWALDLDAAGNLIVADSGNNTIRKITPEGTVTTLAGKPGSYETILGSLSQARIGYPAGLVVDPHTGSLFISVPDAILKVRF